MASSTVHDVIRMWDEQQQQRSGLSESGCWLRRKSRRTSLPGRGAHFSAHHMLGGGSDPPQRLHHMLGGGPAPPRGFATC